MFDTQYLDLFRALIHARTGIYISTDKNYLLESKLTRLLSKSKYRNTQDFYNDLKNNKIDAMEDLVHYITTTHTFFFRESKHLPILINDIKLRKKTNPLIWVAATSTGEEVYSIIISLLEHGIHQFQIVASDINSDVLWHCKKGIYSMERMRELTPDIIEKYFMSVEGNPGKLKVKKYLKDYFILKKINLIEFVRFESKFDYIFCRNVLIYFDQDTQRLVLATLMANLDPLGYLFVGHSESLLHLTNKLESVFSSVYNIKN